MLRLAEPGDYLSAGTIGDNYINMPDATGQIIRVRADLFDELPANEFDAVMMELEPYNAMITMNGFSSWLQGRRDAKTQRQAQRQESKVAKVQAGGGLANVIGNVAKGAASIFGRGTTEPTTRGIDFNVSGTGGTPPTPEVKEWYKNPIVIGGGVIALGALAYILTRPKSKKK